jgi:hypothetical protein
MRYIEHHFFQTSHSAYKYNVNYDNNKTIFIYGFTNNVTNNWNRVSSLLCLNLIIM